MSNNKPVTFSDYDVRVRAHRIWERNGLPEGRAEEHWREALAELEAELCAKSEPVPPLPEVSTPPIRSVADLPKDEAA